MAGAWPRLSGGTDRASRLAGACALLLVAGSMTMLAERLTPARQPGRDVIVRELAPGKLLVAGRNLPDPNFTETVVLLIEYSRDGAAGLVVNRPSGVPLARILPGVASLATVTATAFIGGPVSQGAVLALSRVACAACPPVGRDLYLVNTPDALLARLADGTGAERLRVFVGYAGWGRGQLDAETRQGAWHVLDGDSRVVFDPQPESVWRRMIRRAEGVRASDVDRAFPEGSRTADRRGRVRSVGVYASSDSRQ